MFYSLIPGFVAVLMGISVIASPVVHQVAPSIPAVFAPVMAQESVPQVVRKAEPVIVIEAPARLTFERLRREDSRYPEMGTVGRFVELSTECPPLFE